jgi:acetate kinase
MGTRSGDLDPGVVTYLEREEGMTGAQIDELLNKKSGLLGLSAFRATCAKSSRPPTRAKRAR